MSSPPPSSSASSSASSRASTRVWRAALAHLEALDALEPSARATALAVLEQGDPALHAAIRLLEDDPARTTTDSPGFGPAADSTFAPPFEPPGVPDLARAARAFEPIDHTGRQAGAYRFVRLLGSGGMGQVWLAQRTDGRFEGEVALKLLAFASDAAWVERFRREGQMLARLSHPRIARLLDAGTLPDGQPYLVLERVRGERIDRWCDQRVLDIDARLRLFLLVCDAVAHAHAALVVHRDLKPSNILVTDDGEPKLLDFGVAKMLEGDVGDAAEATELTRQGGRALTPQYAAPEQFSAQPITTATDVYALGVLLYGLLTGRKPYGATASTPEQWAREVAEAEPAAMGALVSDAAARDRATTTDRLRRRLVGDLETIVAKALRKVATERYASAQALADDVHRHLAHEPVAARPDSPAYRVRKFVRRHRVMVLASTVTLASMVVGAVGVAWQYRAALDEAEHAKAVQSFVTGLFEAAHPRRAQGRDVTVRELLTQGETDLTDGSPRSARLKETFSGVLAGLFSVLGDEKRAQALRVEQLRLIEASSRVGTLDHAEALFALGRSRGNAGQTEQAMGDLEQAQRIYERAGGLTVQGRLFEIDGSRAYMHLLQGRLAEARALYATLIPRYERWSGADPMQLLRWKGSYANTQARLGQTQEVTSIFAEMEPGLAAATDAQALDVAIIRSNQAFTLWELGRYAETKRALVVVNQMNKKLMGPLNGPSVGVQRTLGLAYTETGEPVKAAEWFEINSRDAVALFTAGHPEAVLNESFCVLAYVLVGRTTEAEAIARRTHKVALAKADPADRRSITRRLGLALTFSGKAQEAVDVLEALVHEETQASPASSAARLTRLYLAGAYAAAGRHDAAASMAREAAAGPANRVTELRRAKARLTEALARSRLGQHDEAMRLVDEAERGFRDHHESPQAWLAFASLVRADALAARGLPVEARALDADARAALRRIGGTELPATLPLVF